MSKETNLHLDIYKRVCLVAYNLCQIGYIYKYLYVYIYIDCVVNTMRLLLLLLLLPFWIAGLLLLCCCS